MAVSPYPLNAGQACREGEEARGERDVPAVTPAEVTQVPDRDEWEPRRLADGYSAPDRAYVSKQRFEKNARRQAQGGVYAGGDPAPRLQAAVKADALIARARTAGDAGDFAGAVALFEQALALAPGDDEALFGKSHALSVLGHSLVYTDPAHARELLSRAIAVQRSLLATAPRSMGVLINLNSALCDLARTWEDEGPERAAELVAEAIGHIRAALAVAPDDADAAHNLSVTLALAARLAEARDDLDRALALAEQARDAAEDTHRVTPDETEPLSVLVGAVIRVGELHMTRGEPDKAAAQCQGAIELADRLREMAPGDPESVIATARARLAMGGALEDDEPGRAIEHYEGALAGCRSARDAGSDAPELRYWAAQALMAMARSVARWGTARAAEFYEQAIEHFRALSAVAPNDPRPLNDLGFALLRLGQLFEATDPDRARGHLVQALAALEHCVALAPAEWAAWWTLGRCHVSLGTLSRWRGPQDEGHLTAALDAFERALALRPTSPLGLYEVGITLFDLSVVAHEEHRDPDAAMGYLARSIELCERALAAQPEDPWCLTGLQAACTDYGHLLVIGGRAEEGARYLQRGLELGRRSLEVDPDSWATWWNLAMYHIYTAQPAGAFEALREALRADPQSWYRVEADAEWDPLRDHPTYRELEAQYQARAR